MDICFNETPAMFGIFHIAMIVLSVVVVCVFAILVKNKSEDIHIKMIKWFGIGMVAAEIWKQWFYSKKPWGNSRDYHLLSTYHSHVLFNIPN